ncbi:MAG TPA: helix-turn-helix transcriptional regulator [Clostridiales bacterium]|nr:helix-turn-helix transcriptional regulator [Clostridiales bacterium]
MNNKKNNKNSDVRQRVLEAAASLFPKKGYVETRMSEIASGSGCCYRNNL